MDKSFFLVGIGACAGGVDALCEFSDYLSADVDMSFVVVTHLMRDRKSILSNILSNHTSMTVSRVVQDTPIANRYLYVLKENTSIEVKDGWLRIQTRD